MDKQLNIETNRKTIIDSFKLKLLQRRLQYIGNGKYIKTWQNKHLDPKLITNYEFL